MASEHELMGDTETPVRNDIEHSSVSAERLRQAVRVAHIGIFDHDHATGKIHYSPEMRDIFGLDADTPIVLGTGPADSYGTLEIIHPDDLERISRMIRRLHEPESDGSFDTDYRIVRRDGTTRWISVRSQTSFEGSAAARRPVNTVGAVHDVTEVKSVGEALREGEERLRQVINVSHIGVFDHDHLAGNIYYSRELRDMYGLGADEPIVLDATAGGSNGTLDLVHPDDQERVAEAVARGLDPSGDGLFDLEYRIIRRDGSTRWLMLRAQTRFAGTGRARHPARTIGAVSDVSSLKLAEHAVSENEDRLRQVIEVSHIGVFDHNHARGTLYFSASLRKLLGVPPDVPLEATAFEWRGSGPPRSLDSIHPDDRERVAVEFRRVHQEGGIYDIEHRVIRPDGSIIWVAVRSLTTVEGEGDARRPVRTVGAFVDITARKQAEAEREKLQAQLLQAQKMESVGRLAGGVAHDFNNMLSVICGNAELALGQLDAGSPLCEAIEEIQTAARRSAELTGQLLAFARKQTVAPKVLSLNDRVESSLSMVRRLIGEDISAIWTPGQHIWPIRMDPGQIDQILMNLSVNARDAIDGVGQLTIRTANVVLHESDCREQPGAVPGDYVMLEIADDGCGMDAETKSHVFEPFFTTKPDGRGTGLGLAMVYGIVKQNEGFIAISSELGVGTKVQVLFPRFAGSVARVEAETRAQPKSGAETVLLVEDEPLVLGLTRRMLEKLGYTVLPASTPADAVRLAAEQRDRIQLLVTDLVMPDMNGCDMARQLLQFCPHLKCMFVSGYSSDSATLRSAMNEGVRFLQKPFTLTDLAARVRETLDSAY